MDFGACLGAVFFCVVDGADPGAGGAPALELILIAVLFSAATVFFAGVFTSLAKSPGLGVCPDFGSWGFFRVGGALGAACLGAAGAACLGADCFVLSGAACLDAAGTSGLGADCLGAAGAGAGFAVWERLGTEELEVGCFCWSGADFVDSARLFRTARSSPKTCFTSISQKQKSSA